MIRWQCTYVPYYRMLCAVQHLPGRSAVRGLEPEQSYFNLDEIAAVCLDHCEVHSSFGIHPATHESLPANRFVARRRCETR